MASTRLSPRLVGTTFSSSKDVRYLRQHVEAANYALSSDRGSNNRVIMLSNVAVGQSCKMYSAASYLNSPPPGYHSVRGIALRI